MANSNQFLNLNFDHLQAEQAGEKMKKLGLLSGSKNAIENGVTTQTEKVVGGGGKSNPRMQLTQREEDYVISQLIQKNFDTRRGLSVFKSKTGRSSIIKTQGSKRSSQIPPIGQYEHQFNSGIREKPQLDNAFNRNSVPQKYVAMPNKKLACTQAFSCFAETR